MIAPHEEFVRTISQKIEDARNRPISPHEEYVIIFLLHGVRYAIPAESVIEILRVPPLTPVPGAERSLQGIFMHRSKVVPVIDLVRRLLPNVTSPRVSEQVIVIEVNGVTFGILVERTLDATVLHDEHIEDILEDQAERVSGEYLTGSFLYEHIEKSQPFLYGFFIAAPGLRESLKEDTGERKMNTRVYLVHLPHLVKALGEGRDRLPMRT